MDSDTWTFALTFFAIGVLCLCLAGGIIAHVGWRLTSIAWQALSARRSRNRTRSPRQDPAQAIQPYRLDDTTRVIPSWDRLPERGRTYGRNHRW